MTNWSFLTNHGRALLCIAHDPEIRLRDIAADLGITERHAYAVVTDLTDAGYIVKEREGPAIAIRYRTSCPCRNSPIVSRRSERYWMF